MATTNFDTGTVVTKEWLNDADALIYEGDWPATVVPKTDTISEETADAGVTIDGVQCKDSTVVMGSPFNFRNKIINGNFDIWQRRTSISITGFAADRWTYGVVGSTFTGSRQAFTLGQTDVPGNPQYYIRTEVTSAAGESNYCVLIQYIEGVTSLAGRTVTLSFWAKADAAKSIATELLQRFGTGGSPSADVTTIGVTKHNLTTSWQKFTVTVTLPSISGKTLGSNNNDALAVLFWFEAGSTYNARTNTLGQQSGTFDIARVQLEEGSVATPFEERPFGIEYLLCKRYYQKSFPLNVAPVQNAGGAGAASILQIGGAGSAIHIILPILNVMRATPVVTTYNPNAANDLVRNVRTGEDSVRSVFSESPDLTIVTSAGTTSSLAADQNRVHWTADAEL